jgi:hypothetical protein
LKIGIFDGWGAALLCQLKNRQMLVNRFSLLFCSFKGHSGLFLFIRAVCFDRGCVQTAEKPVKVLPDNANALGHLINYLIDMLPLLFKKVVGPQVYFPGEVSPGYAFKGVDKIYEGTADPVCNHYLMNKCQHQNNTEG